MTQDGMRGQRIDFLFAFLLMFSVPTQTCRNRYVDEVQDNLLIDVKGGYFLDLNRDSEHLLSKQSSEPCAGTQMVNFGRGIPHRRFLSAALSALMI